VAILAPNIPEMLEAHYGVPMSGAILLTINIRLDAAAIGFILRHSGARLLLVDSEFAGVAVTALAGLDTPPVVIDIADPEGPAAAAIGARDYEAFLAGGDPAQPIRTPEDEWEAIALSYTCLPEIALDFFRACLGMLSSKFWSEILAQIRQGLPRQYLLQTLRTLAILLLCLFVTLPRKRIYFQRANTLIV